MNKSLLFTGILIFLTSCGQADPVFDRSAHAGEVLEWRAGRLERLLAPLGYLNQTGLFWLEEGSYRFGSDPGNDIVFSGDAAAEIGIFEVSAEGVRMTVSSGVSVSSDDFPVDNIVISDDTSDAPVTIKHRSLAWSVVKRDGRYAVRVRDFEHPFAATFGPLPYFDVDAAWRVSATLQRYEVPRTANVRTVIEGLGYHPQSPGIVVFEFGGQRFELEAYESGDDLFFVFGDETSRDDTYGAGRFLYASNPGEDGATILDFNKAYSPPCAFNDFSTCPVASPRNRLPIRVEAGEKYDPSLHYAAH